MSLTALNDIFIDIEKISYIGKPDSHVKAHVGVVIYYFLVVVDGHPIEIVAESKKETIKLRKNLIEEINKIVGYLPG